MEEQTQTTQESKDLNVDEQIACISHTLRKMQEMCEHSEKATEQTLKHMVKIAELADRAAQLGRKIDSYALARGVN